MNKILNILLIIILLSSFAIADSGVYDNVNHHEYNIYNVTNATATTFFGALTGTASIATLWASVTSYNSTQFTDISNILNIDMSWLTGIIEGLDNDTKYTAGDYLYLDGTEFNVNGTDLNATIDARDTDTTYTAGTGLILTSTVFSRNKSFFDTNYYNQTLADTTFITKANEGNLNVNHSDTSGNAGTVTNGVYTTDFPLNQDTTGTAAIATSWDGETSQADLNVNSSAYWDSLNSPTDITSLGTISSATSITSTIFLGPLTGTASIATLWASVTSFASDYFYDNSNVLTLNETKLNKTINALENNTEYTAGNYLYLDGTEFNVNETDLNATIDARENNTEYSAGSYLYLSGTQFNVNETDLNATIDNRDTDTTYSSGVGLILTSTTFSRNQTFFDKNYYNQTLADSTFIEDSSEGDLNVNSSVYWDNETSQANLNVNSSDYWDSYGDETDLTINWSQITNEVLRAVDDVYLYLSGNIITFNDTKNNATINAIATIYNDSMKTYTDNTFITQANEGNLNVNYSTTSGTATTWDGETSQGNLNVNSSTTSGTATTWDGETSQANLNVNSSTYTSFWASVSSFVSSWFYDNSNVLSFNESKLNNTIDARSDFDSRWSVDGTWIYNNSGDLSWNTTSGDARYYTQTAANSQFIEDSSEGDLNVNSSDYWDSLGSPSDINAGDITDDGTYYDTTSNMNVTNYNITASRFISDIVTGTSPFSVASTTLVTNLNANMVEGTDLGTLTDGKACTYDLAGTEIDCDTTLTLGTVTSVTGSSPITSSEGTTPAIGLTACSNAEGYVYNTTSSAWECRALGSGSGSVTSIATDDVYLTGGPITGSGTITFNETLMNDTIDARSTSTEYTAGKYLYLDGTQFNVNDTMINDSIESYDYATVTSLNTKINITSEGDLNVNSSTYWDSETSQGDLNVNYSTTSGTATTWDSETSQSNLNVNSSNYWDGLNTPSDINAGDITDDGTYRLDSWNNLTGIPHATPADGDITHFSLSDEIYDWVIGLSYSTTVGTVTSVTGSTPITSTEGTTPEIGITMEGDLVTTAPLTGAANDIFPGTGTKATIAATILKDLVTTAPLTGGTNDVFLGTDSDLTVAITVLKDIVAGIGMTGGEDNVLPGADADVTLNVNETWVNDTIESYGYSTTTGTVTSVATDDTYLTGGTITTTGTITLNETLLNTTIDARSSGDLWSDPVDSDIIPDTDATYTFGNTTNGFTTVFVDKIEHPGDSNNFIDFNSADNIRFTTGGSIRLVLNNQGMYVGGSGAGVTTIYDNDTLGEDSATALATQQSIKKYVDDNAGTGTVTSVATDDTYLTGGAITTTGTITFSTALAGTDLAVNSSDNWDGLDSPTDITSLGTIGSATSITSTAFVGPLTGTADVATTWASVTSFIAKWFYDNGNVLTFNETALNDSIESYGYSTTVGTVTGVSGTSPIVSSGGATPAISATILKDLVTTAPITGAADNIFLGTDSDITIAMPVASTSADGYLSSTNWNTFNNKASSDTTYSAGNGISESSEVFSVAGNTALTQDADGLSVTAGGIGDTQIADAYINQALTTTSNPTFNNITVTTCIIFASGGKFCSGT